MIKESEYSASDIRKILQQLFPQRRLVLSQFTFYNHAGVAVATGETFQRGRRRYRLSDLLPVACVLALKEEGIPLKNISAVPELLQKHAHRIFEEGKSCRISGFADTIVIENQEEPTDNFALERFLNEASKPQLFWSYDVGVLANQLKQLVTTPATLEERHAA